MYKLICNRCGAEMNYKPKEFEAQGFIVMVCGQCEEGHLVSKSHEGLRFENEE